MKLRLYHHRDGARVAYRESGTGPALALFHSAGLSHMEFEPIVELLEDRFRVILTDVPPDELQTVRGLAACIARKSAERGAE